MSPHHYRPVAPSTMRCACFGALSAPNSRRRFMTAAAAFGVSNMLIPGVRAASGKYEAMLISCIDPRFPKLTLDYMTARSLEGRYSQFSIAGAAIGAVAPKFQSWHQALWDNLAASIQLHAISTVIALNHRDCGAAQIAYGQAAVASREAETVTHREALFKFRTEVTRQQPALKVELGLMDLNGKVERFS